MKTKITLLLFILSNIILAQTLDTSFNGAGYSTFTTLNQGNPVGVHQQATGKYVVAIGTGNSSNGQFYASRLDVNGTIDTTFGTNGITLVDFGTGAYSPTRSAMQADGKIVIVGYSIVGSEFWGAIARLTVDGQLDPTFNGTGTLLLSPTNGGTRINGIKIDSNNKILTYGSYNDGTQNIGLLCRLNQDGSFDNTFASGGKLFSLEMTDGFVINADNSITMPFGTPSSNNPPTLSKAWLRKITNTGQDDTSFGVNGRIQIPFSATASPGANKAWIQVDGKILVAGTESVSTVPFYQQYITRINPNGTLDSTFGTSGFVFLSNTSSFHFTVDTNNKIVASGEKIIITPGVGVTYPNVLWRFNSDGSIDNTFGTNGLYVENLTNIASFRIGFIIDNQDRLIAPFTGNTFTGIARYNVSNLSSQTFNLTQNFSIFPNPSNGTFNIKIDDDMLGANAAIYSLLGQKMNSFEVTNDVVNQNFASGIYVLEIEKNGQKLTQKLIIE